MTLPRRWFRADDPPAASEAAADPAGPKIVVVGPCASGKSTLAAGLRRMGFDAVPVGQEHSDIPSLWRHADPDIVVALAADLDAIRLRRDEAAWPEWLYDVQQRRLRDAREAAAFRIDTTGLDPQAILQRVADFLDSAAGQTEGATPSAGQLTENPDPG
jgi:hypothetical protein